MAETVTCKVCEKPFTKTHYNKIYCSSECKGKSANMRRRRKRHNMICEGCGSRFMGRRSDQRFCSSKCYHKQYRKNHPKERSVWAKGRYGRHKARLNSINRRNYRRSRGIPEEWDLRRESSIEYVMKEWLNEVGIDFIEQHRINLNGRSYTKVDFFIPRMKICLYCDGDYWHSKLEVRERDVRIDRELEALGYIVFRTSQSEILNGMRPHWILEQYEHVALAVVC